jgi:hypothetical protein
MNMRVTLEDIKNRIASVEYLHPDSCRRMTLCVLTMDNGFAVCGMSVAADMAHFDEGIGKEMAYDDAVNNMWPMEFYLRFEAKMTEQAA